MPGSSGSPSSNPRLVFLLPWAPSETDRFAYGAEALGRLGVESTFVDVGPLLGGKVDPRPLDPGIVRVNDYTTFDRLVAEATASGAVFVDYIVGLDEIAPDSARLFRALARHDARFIVIAAGTLPSSSGGEAPDYVTLRLKLHQAMRLKRWYRLARRLIIRRLRRWGTVFPLPTRVFATHAESSEVFIARYRYPASRVSWVNSRDYSSYLTWRSRHGAAKRSSRAYAIFLDEAAATHPDFEILDIEHLRPEPEAYAAAMRAFFDEFERRAGMPVIIAEHPRANYGDRPGFFGDRETVAGKSLDLVAGASAVLMHSTTAASFAVILDVPLMCIETRDMVRTGYGLQVARMAAGLQLKPIVVDAPGALDSVDWDPNHWSHGGFSAYLEKYIRSPEAGDATTWESIAAVLRAGSATS